MIIENLNKIFRENKINLHEFIASLQPKLGVDAIFGTLNREYNHDANRLLTAVFEMADNLIHSYPSTKEKYYSKGFVKRTIIFKNGYVTFRRRKYCVRPEYYSSITPDQKATVFLLDKYIGIEKYQRLDFDFAIDIIREIGVNFSYQDIANKFEQSGITKQTVFGLIKKLCYSDLLEKILERPIKKLNHNGVIYFETDDTFSHARCKGNSIRMKAITMGVCHTGYIDENAKRKQIDNKRFFIKISNEDCNFNTKEYWNAVKKFININYEDAESAKIVVLGDGAGKIRACEKWNDWEFIIDRFHIKKRIRDAVRGNSKYKDRASEVVWHAICRYDWTSVCRWINALIKNELKRGKPITFLTDLLTYLWNVWEFILRWQKDYYIGCRVEAYNAQIIKVMFRSRPKIFNEDTIGKVFLAKQLVLNGINIFDEMKEIARENFTYERETYKFRFNRIEKYQFGKIADLPILKNSSNKNMALIIRQMTYNY